MFRTPLLAATLTLVLAGPAHAQPLALLQDDGALLGGSERQSAMLTGWKAMGGTNVRVNLTHGKPLAAYDQAITAIVNAGLTPQVTLTWSDPDVDQAPVWMGEMAARYRDRVSMWSVLNEPDLTLASDYPCDPVSASRMLESSAVTDTLKDLYSKRYLYRTITFKRHGRKVRKRVPVYVTRRAHRHHRIIRLRHRKFVMVKRTVPGDQQTSTSATLSVEQTCRAVARGHIYHDLFTAAAEQIRANDPGATVLAGEFSPWAVAAVTWDAAKPLPADGVAVHPYQFGEPPTDRSPNGAGNWGIGNLDRICQAVDGLPVYITEFGYQQSDPHDDWLIGAWRAAAVSPCIREMAQYDWAPQAPDWTGTWDTSLTSFGKDALASFLAQE